MDGKKVRIIRIEKGLSQKELSEKAGIDYTYISAIENNKKTPSIPLLVKIANALDCSVKDFF
jgi:transcriptional regulator with XRE-family HTH domain